MATPSLLFVPDISGFTKFVNETELSHSQHIISELINLIINQNILNMQISEIEGDAVLFYRTGAPPSFDEIIKQTKKMFVSFHSYLNSIEQNNVCQCGTCTSVSNLSLKFFTHFGELSEVKINKFNKLMGSDVILVHRLMKNNVPSKEYLLLTEKYVESLDNNLDTTEDWVKFEENEEEINNFGKIKTKYVTLSNLKRTIPPPLKSDILKLEGKVGKLAININADLLTVHSVLSNVEAKKHWVKGLMKIKNPHKINRVKNIHTCEFSKMKMDVTTLSNQVCENEITFTEEGLISGKTKIIFEFILNEAENGTNVLLGFYSANNTDKNLIDRIKSKIILKMLLNMMKSNLKRLKNYCEEL